MNGRPSNTADRRWRLLPVVLFAFALMPALTTMSAQSGGFPAFIPMPGVTPRGVAVDRIGNVFVSVGKIQADNLEHILLWKYSPDGVGPTFLADIGRGTIGGLTVTANGELYVALAAGLDRGVWRLDRDGWLELLPGSGQIFFANGLAFDDRGTLYVTESVSTTVIIGGKPAGPGGIWRIPRGGDAELWMRDELLRGTGALGQPVWIGANGIAYSHGSLYVTNTEKGTVVCIPVQHDGSPGEPEWWPLQDVPESPMPLPPMGDGLILDVHGALYVAVLTQSAVVRIDAETQSQETVAVFLGVDPIGPPPDAPLDFPASLWFGTGKGARTDLFVTNLGMGAAVAPVFPWPGPGLTTFHAGVPGEPLH